MSRSTLAMRRTAPSWSPRRAGGVMRARRALALGPGSLRLPVVDMIEVSVSTLPGKSAATFCAIMPPIDAPTRCARAMPSASRSAAVSRAMSAMRYGAFNGRRSRYLIVSRATRGVPCWSNCVESPASRLSKRTTRKPFAASISQNASGQRTICIPRPITSRMTGSAGLPRDSYSSDTRSARIDGTVWVVEEVAAPSLAVEGTPSPLGLREAIGHRVPGDRIHAHADVARGNLDALGAAAALLQAAGPRDDAVGAAEDGRGGHGGGLAHARELIGVVELVAARVFVEAPHVVRARMAGEGRAQGDHAAHVVGCDLGDLARECCAHAPADEAHLAPRGAAHLAHVLEARLDHARARAEVEAQLPAVGAVAGG